MRGKVIEVLFEDNTKEQFQTQSAFKEWYCKDKGWGPASLNCNVYGKLKGTDKSYKKHGISDIYYVSAETGERLS